MKAEKEMEILEELPDILLLDNDVTVEIYKCKVRQLTKVSTFLRVVLKELGINNIESQDLKIDLNDPNTYLILFDNCRDATLDLIVSLCSLDRDQLENLDLDMMIDLVKKIFEVNKSFFLNRVMPLLSELQRANQTQ
jgi:hypothetical protein